ncbi:hypothetical protein OEZ86_012737 [Tetradesmus obliquus]|uniref:Uncharacterized protein n=2 Tax=Tetradesmus obliquus TaxID=3088 RepID=A0ABY8U172_TETOB|nr:hypothetical protein OEZ85_002761 [Tetradesmus obliquus]WIA34401.1 hypothetical protein OEZ86_012737 [Tetradesmus obliquus]|eukprot:jgi/Sobl393_1/20089/SZX79162.1
MVNATSGALLTCDVPTKEFLVWLNNQNKATKRAFIIKELDDTHLLVKEDMVEFVQEQVKAFNNKNVYTPPVPIE